MLLKTSFKLLLIFFIFVLLPYIGNAAKNNKKENKLTIFFKTTECASKCYFPLQNINNISKKIKIEFVIDREEKDYALEIISGHQVNPKSYSLRAPSVNEKNIYSGPLSYYIFQTKDITLFGTSLLLDYLSNNIDSLLLVKPSSAKLLSKNSGTVGIFPPFEVVGNKSFIYEERLKKFYIDSLNGGRIIQTRNYFNQDSTYLIFRIFPEWKKSFYESAKSNLTYDGTSISSIANWKGKQILLGTFTSALTPLYKANKRKFLIYFDDSIISRKNYTYIDDNKRLNIGLYSGIGINKKQNDFTSFHSIVWQKKRNADSFFVAQYNYSANDSTWHQGDIYVLDTARKDIEYSENLQFISSNYAIHSDLPILYSYPKINKHDLSQVLSNIFQKPIANNVRLPKGFNIGQVWNDDKVVKFLCGSQNGFYCVTYKPQTGRYEIKQLSFSSLPPIKQFRNFNFDTEGNPVLLYHSGKNHEVYKIE